MHLYKVSVTLWLKIAPVLDYGALLQKGSREGVRYFLEVSNKQTQTEDSGGMCWTTTKYRHQLNMVMFWIHLLQTEKGRTIKKGFSECKCHGHILNVECSSISIKALVMVSHSERQSTWCLLVA